MSHNHEFTFHGLPFAAVVHIHMACEHGPVILRRLDGIDERISNLIHQGVNLMATARELVTLSQTVVDEVSKLPGAVNTLEAAVTAALAKLPTVPPDVQADIDKAFSNMTTVLSTAQATIADAADGIDEVTVPTP